MCTHIIIISVDTDHSGKNAKLAYSVRETYANTDDICITCIGLLNDYTIKIGIYKQRFTLVGHNKCT